MRSRRLVRLVLVWLLPLASLYAAPSPKPAELIVLAYDSFAAEGGLGPAIIPIFERECGCKVRLIPAGDGGQVLNRIELDQKRAKLSAHVALGIDQNSWPRAKSHALSWDGWIPKGSERIVKDARAPDGASFLPFDYGVFALMADTQLLGSDQANYPTRLNDLLSPRFKRKILLQDPRTSTPGMAFLLFTHGVAGTTGDEFEKFWRAMRSQWLTLTPGWDESYGLFLKGEAPLVWSYVTSQAYHREHGDTDRRYRAILFEEGQPVQIEGAILLKPAATNLALSRMFLEFLLSSAVQSRIPKTNWMYPVIQGTPLPDSFSSLPRAKVRREIAPDVQQSLKILKRWGAAVEGQ